MKNKQLGYYIYVYLDPTKFGFYSYCGLNNKRFVFDCEPFYVGKGKEKSNRHLSHLKEAESTDVNSYKCNKIRKIINDGYFPIIEIIKTSFDEDECYNFEKELINIIGKYSNKGPLTNRKDGGLGGLGGMKLTNEQCLKIGERSRKFYTNPDNRKKQSLKMIEICNHPDHIKKQSEITSNNWKDPIIRKNRLKNRSFDKSSQSLKKIWEDLEYRKRQSESHIEYYENNPEAKIKISIEQKKLWNDPTYAIFHRKKINKSIRSEKSRKKNSESKKKYYDLPGIRDKHSEIQKKRYEDPRERLKCNTRSKKYKIISPEGKIFNIENMAKFCRENNLCNSSMSSVSKGHTKQHKEWRCIEIG